MNEYHGNEMALIERKKKTDDPPSIGGHVRGGDSEQGLPKRGRLGNAVRETNAISRLIAVAEFQWSR